MPAISSTFVADSTFGAYAPAPPPQVRLARAAAQAIGDNLFIPVFWDTHEVAPSGIAHDVAVASEVITILTQGLYHVTYHLLFTANATGQRLSKVVVNNAAPQVNPSYGFDESNNGTIRSNLHGSATLRLEAGDTLHLYVLQTSGISLDISGGSVDRDTRMSITKLE
jgi:hypothetical protein